MPFLYHCCDELTGVSCASLEASNSSSPTGCCIKGTECLAIGTPIEDLETLVVDDENDEIGGGVVVPGDEDDDDDDDDDGGSDSDGDDDPAGSNAGNEDNNDREAEDEEDKDDGEDEDSDDAADATDAATTLSERIADVKRCLIGLGLAVLTAGSLAVVTAVQAVHVRMTSCASQWLMYA